MEAAECRPKGDLVAGAIMHEQDMVAQRAK